MHPEPVLRHQPQLRLLLLHHGEVVEACLYVQKAPQVSFPLFIHNVQRLLHWIIALPRVCIELYKIAAEPVVLALLPLLYQHNPAGALTVRNTAQHPHALHLLNFFAHPLALLGGQGRGALKYFCTRFDFGVKGVRSNQTHITLSTS